MTAPVASTSRVITTEVRPDGGWLGLDHHFYSEAANSAAIPRGVCFRRNLEAEMSDLRGKESTSSGVPLLVQGEAATEVRQFACAYHRCIEVITRAWRKYGEVRRVVALPQDLSDIVHTTPSPGGQGLHLCRLDLLLRPDGGYSAVETNANCPGGLGTTGYASREWRRFLTEEGFLLPPPLEHEADLWMARWFLDTAESETGRRPSFVPVLRWEGGNRLGVPGLVSQLREVGVEAIEADPRELTTTRHGTLALEGRPVRHAYWKLGLRELSSILPGVGPLVSAVQTGELFVQNGVAARFVGDSKLCLAILSDPAFSGLFRREDLTAIRPHIPWSRNAGLCTTAELRAIRSNPAAYVLKRPLDTRGRGVKIGREVSNSHEWSRTLDRAVSESWLVQEFCGTAQLRRSSSVDPSCLNHDLSVGLSNGSLIAAMSRSSSELRTNVALTGCLHPVFMRLPPHSRHSGVSQTET